MLQIDMLRRRGLITLTLLSIMLAAFCFSADAQVKKQTRKSRAKVINTKPIKPRLPEGAKLTEGSKPGWTKYVDTRIGYSFEFPSNWIIFPMDEGGDVGLFVTDQPDFFRKRLPEVVYINVSRPTTYKVDLRQLIEHHEKSMSEAKGLELIKSEFTTWNGAEARETESKGLDKFGIMRHFLIRTAVIEGTIVSASLFGRDTKFAKYLPTFTEIADSLKLTK